MFHTPESSKAHLSSPPEKSVYRSQEFVDCLFSPKYCLDPTEDVIKTTDRSEDMKARPCHMSITSTDGRPEASVVSPSAGTRKMAGRWQARKRHRRNGPHQRQDRSITETRLKERPVKKEYAAKSESEPE